MAVLTIVRPSGSVDILRGYKVILDGQPVGQIKDGETKQFTVSAGPHQLALNIDWCGSKTIQFTANEGDNLNFHARSNLSGKNWFYRGLWYMLFQRDSYLLIEQDPASQTSSSAVGAGW